MAASRLFGNRDCITENSLARKRRRAGALRRPPCEVICSFSDLSSIYYGSFCSRVRMFCGMVLACATIAVLACCRIWALDNCEVACA